MKATSLFPCCCTYSLGLGRVVVLGGCGVDGFEQLRYFGVDESGMPAEGSDGVSIEGTDLHIGEVFGEFVGENAVDLWFGYQVAEADAAEVFAAEGVCRDRDRKSVV